nr:FUSC family protein [Leucobacter luti]
MFSLPPGPAPRGWIATRAAASMGVPLAVLTLLGREDLGLQAAVGAFLALFVAGAAARERAKVLPIVGVALFACAALGVALAPWPLWLAVGLVVVAVGVSGLAFAFRLGPPGPVFFVLIYGLSGMITAVRDGERVSAPGTVLLTMLAGMVFSYLVALTPLLRRAERARPARPLRALLPGPWLGAGEQELLLRVAVVAVLGTVISVVWLDPHRAYWTVSAGVAVVGLAAGRSHALGRGLHRTAGTLLGAAVYLAIAPLGASPVALVLLLTALQFSIEIVVVRNYALALVFITPLVLLITGSAAGGDPFASAGERVLDTAVGSALAIGSALLHRREARG